MPCSFANASIPDSRRIPLVDSASDINVGARIIYVEPGDLLPWAIDAAARAGSNLCSVSDVVVTEASIALNGVLTVDASDVQGGSVLLLINATLAGQGDEWIITLKIHPTPEQTLNASVRVVARAA